MTKEKDIKAYNLALRFLQETTPVKNPAEFIQQYLQADSNLDEHLKIPDLFKRLLISAQNASMKAGVIGGSIDGIENLSIILFNFSPTRVIEFYGDDSEKLLEQIISKLNPRGKIRKTPQSIWPKYCRTILSAASFFSQFRSSSNFYEWTNHYYQDEKSFAALPLILSEEIYGIGFPLACDFLKEIGYLNFGKPDVHIKDIFKEIGLIDKNDSNYQIQKAFLRIAKNVGVTPYAVDKVFWLIGSGTFYNHPELGNNGRTGRKKQKFIAYYQNSA